MSLKFHKKGLIVPVFMELLDKKTGKLNKKRHGIEIARFLVPLKIK